MMVRLEGRKKPISKWVFNDSLKSDPQPSTLTLKTLSEKNSPLGKKRRLQNNGKIHWNLTKYDCLNPPMSAVFSPTVALPLT